MSYEVLEKKIKSLPEEAVAEIEHYVEYISIIYKGRQTNETDDRIVHCRDKRFDNMPKEELQNYFIDTLNQFPDDFMKDGRNQPQMQERTFDGIFA